MTIATSLNWGLEQIQPRLEVELLLAHATNKTRENLLTWPQQAIATSAQKLFQNFILRRKTHEPIAYITLYTAAALTIWSMLIYLKAAWPELKKNHQ